MNEDQAPEVHEFFYGLTDVLAVQEYLNVKDDGEIARLAAMMVPKAKSFDPAALVDAAMALQTETKSGLIRRREAMVSTMNHSTLFDLQKALGYEPIIYMDDNDERLCDPIIGPVLRKLHATVSAGLKQSDELEKARIAAQLANADTRTKLPRPNLPGDLEEVLRYATNAPRVPWAVLEKAFLDYIGLFNQIGRDKHEEGFQQKCRDDYSKALAELGETEEDEARRNELQASVDQCQRKLTDIQNSRNFRENFTPEQEIPTGMSEAAAISYATYFQSPGCARSPDTLAWLSTDFYAFWEKHRDAYQELHAAVEKARKTKVAKNRKAAPKGPASREGNIKLKQTQDFVTFLNANQPPQADRSELIKTFANEHCGLSSKPAKIKVQGFLRMLSSYEGREFDGRTMLEILRKIGIKALTADAVRECLMVLKSAAAKGRGKNRKNRFDVSTASSS